MSTAAITYTDAFADAYREITSRPARNRIRSVIETIMTFPDIGAARPRKSLIERYGKQIRTIPAGTYVIVYEHRDATLVLIALVPGKLIT